MEEVVVVLDDPGRMITLYQHPASPFCIAVEAILRFAKAGSRAVN